MGDDIQFTYAEDSDFNVMKDKRYPFIVLGLINSNASYAVNNTTNFVKVWNITIAFYELDHAGSIQEEYSLILDKTDRLVDTFIQRLNFFSYNGDIDIVIFNINSSPFLKAMTDILTGHLLTFQIQAPDNWDYCENGC
jgi:hypothetical protein